MALPRRQRLTGATRIARVFKTTRPVGNECVAVRVAVNGTVNTVFTAIVPATVCPTATQRSALRRRIHEALRVVLKSHAVRAGYDVVMTARAKDATVALLSAALVPLLKKSGILQQ